MHIETNKKFVFTYLLIFLLILFCGYLFFLLVNPYDKNKCIKGDCKNGYGTYIYNSGMKYEGQWKNGKRHGNGILTYPDGSKYEGEWKNNRAHGYGIKSSPVRGRYRYKYIGEWKNGNKHGKGIQYFWHQRIGMIGNGKMDKWMAMVFLLVQMKNMRDNGKMD